MVVPRGFVLGTLAMIFNKRDEDEDEDEIWLEGAISSGVTE